MKQIILLSLLIFGFFLSKAQTLVPCTNTLTSSDFKVQKQNFQVFTGEVQKLNESKKLCSAFCLSATQVKELMGLLVQDMNRYELARHSVSKLSDPENNYILLDGFSSYSTAFRFYELLKSGSKPTETKPVPLPAQLNFPSPTTYSGMSFCSTPVSEADYEALKKQCLLAQTESAKLNRMVQLTNNYCLSTAQYMVLCQGLDLESSRLVLLKAAYSKSFDPGNFSFAGQLFKEEASKVEFLKFIEVAAKGGGDPVPPTPAPKACEVTQTDLDDMIQSVRKQSFSSSKVTLAKQVLKSGECFKVSQVLSIVKLMDYDSDRLDIAKYAWDYTIDKKNYYLLNQAFSFESSGTELSKFVESKH